MSTLEELSAAFLPCTDAGLCDQWHALNVSIRELRNDRNRIAEILLAKSVAGADMSVDPAFRVGATIAGELAQVRAVWHVDSDGRGQWRPRLDYVREARGTGGSR